MMGGTLDDRTGTLLWLSRERCCGHWHCNREALIDLRACLPAHLILIFCRSCILQLAAPAVKTGSYPPSPSPSSRLCPSRRVLLAMLRISNMAVGISASSGLIRRWSAISGESAANENSGESAADKNSGESAADPNTHTIHPPGDETTAALSQQLAEREDLQGALHLPRVANSPNKSGARTLCIIAKLPGTATPMLPTRPAAAINAGTPASALSKHVAGLTRTSMSTRSGCSSARRIPRTPPKLSPTTVTLLEFVWDFDASERRPAVASSWRMREAQAATMVSQSERFPGGTRRARTR